MGTKILSIILVLLMTVGWTYDGGWDQGDIPAGSISVNTDSFTGNLTTLDTDVQKALETLDQLIASGSTNWDTIGGLQTDVNVSGFTNDPPYITQAGINWDAFPNTPAFISSVIADSPLSGSGTSGSHLTVDLSSKQNELGLTGSSGNVSGTTFTATTFTGALNGNASTVTTNANLTGPITSVGNATSVAAQTGTGSTFVMSVAPTFTGNVTAGTVTATTFTGALNGNATTATGALGLVAGTYADGKYCTYTASGTVLNCNSEGGGGSGTVEGTFVAGRVTFASGTSTLTDDGDMTFSTDTLTATKIVAPTSVSTPSLISTGAIGITPAAGSNLNITTSTTGDVAVNTSQLYVDASSGNVGVGTATPDSSLAVSTTTDGIGIKFIPAGYGGIDSNTLGILHLDNNVTDSATSYSRTWTNNNATYANSAGNYKFGYSAVFGGTAYIDTPNAAELNFTTGDFTVDFWMKTTQTTSGFIAIKCGSAANDWGWYFRVNQTANKISLDIYDTSDKAVTSSTTINDGAWHHIAVVRSGSSVKLYVNGVSEGTPITTAGTLRTSTAKLTIGRLGEANSNYYTGYIDEFRVSSSARWTGNFTPSLGAYDVYSPFESPTLTFKGASTTKWTVGSDGSDSDKFKIGSTALGTGTALTISGTTLTYATPFVLGTTTVTTTGTQLNYLNAATGTTGTTSSNVVYSASPTFTGTTSHAIITASGTFNSTATSDIGWSVKSAANTACNTTCTYACVHGWDTAVTEVAVSCTDASADKCLCAGGS
jgi:hypothetical protein